MAKQKYSLNKGEKIVFKTSCVRHGFWGAYTHALTITNQSVILEKYGMFNNFKGIERYNYTDINQAIQGEASNGEKQLELYIGNKVEDFALHSGDDNELKILVMAINDQMGPDAEYCDFKYYQDLVTGAKDTDRLLELRKMAAEEDGETAKSGIAIAGTAAKNILKSGDLSIKGVTKSITKAAGKQKKKGILSGMMDEFLDDIGIRDIQDEFTEMGNEFREEFGLKPKMTHADRKELEELEEKMRKQEIQQSKNSALNNKINEQKIIIEEKKKTQPKSENNKSLSSVNEQLDALKKAKELLDAGILTQEEFEQKKKEIMEK